MQQAATAVATSPTAALQPFTAAPKLAAVGGSGGPQREVFGFGLLSSLSDPTIGYPSWNFSLLSTVAVFGLQVQSNGSFAANSGWSVWNSSQMTGLLSAAHRAGTKVVLTIILQDFSSGTPTMCSGLQARATTVAQTVSEVAAKGVDGVNVDYEGLNGTCANGENPRSDMTDLVSRLRSKLTPGAYLSVDTYASSAGDPSGFFDIPGLNNAGTDSFFVMAYDSDWSNFGHAPLNACSHYCLSPVSPLTGYFYNDTRAATEYIAAVPASKVILGLPYYSRGACVSAWAPNQFPNGGTGTWTLSYRAAASMATDPTNANYVLHRDANDPGGLTPWSTWTSTNTSCQPMEMYWDDLTSLGQKYDLVNRDKLRGVGLWNLNLGGGTPGLWSTLSTYFSCPITISSPASPATSEFSVDLSAGGCSVASFDIQQYDSTLNQGWYDLPAVSPSGSSGSAVVEGYPGHAYLFRARAHSTAGVIGSWSTSTTTVAANASYSHPFRGFYTLDGYGGMHAAASPPLSDSAYWGWNIARTARAWPGPTAPQSGFVLDGWGGLHPYGAPGPVETSDKAGHYWPGWNIARDFAFLPDGSGGFVLDGYGGLHPFGVNGNPVPRAQGFTYWGWDIARKIVIFSDGSGGYVLDGYGGLHPFGINGPAPVAGTSIAGGGYWPGWDIVHDVVLIPGDGNHSGYLLDGYGGLHPFHPTTDSSSLPATVQAPYFGWDIGRSIWLLPGSATAGYVLDGYGGIHPFGAAPATANTAYWPGWDIARVAWGG